MSPATPDAVSFLPFLPPAALVAAFVVLLVGTTFLKGLALWHAARNRQPFWFAGMLVVNTLGILELVYLVGFRKDKQVYMSQPSITKGS